MARLVETRTVSVLEPVAEPAPIAGRLADRQPDLRGKTVGLLDNGQINANVFLRRVGDLLVERCGAVSVVHRRKEFWTRGATQATIDELAGTCHAVVTGWGS
jgi:hypothetical protein